METSIAASLGLDTSGFDRAMERVKSGLSGIKAGIQSVEKAGLKLAGTGLGLDGVTSQIQAADALAGNNIIETFLKGLSEALEALGAWASANRGTIVGTLEGIGVAMAAWGVAQFNGGILGILTGLGSLDTALDILSIKFPGLAGALSAGLEAMRNYAGGIWSVVDGGVGLMANLLTIGDILKLNGAAWAAATKAKLIDKGETLALMAMYAKDMIVGIATSTARLVENAAAWAVATGAKLWDNIASAASTVATTAMSVATAAWNVVGGIAAAITTAFGVAVQIATSPVTLIILAILALIAIIVLLIKFWPEITAAAAAAWEWILNAWATVADWFNANVIQPVVGFFTGLWSGITEAVTAAVAWLVNAWGVVASWFSTNVIQPVAGFFTNLWAQVSGAVSAAVQWLLNVWSTVSNWINVNVIQPIVGFFTNLWTQLNTAVTTAVQWLVNAWSTVASWINANVVQPIVGFFTGLWTQLGTAVSSAINLFTTAWSTVATWFNTNVIQPIAGFFTGLWDSIRKLFTSVGTTIGNAVGGAFRSAVNAVIGFVEGTINLLIRGINAAIGIINLIPGVNIRTLSMLSIPRMAQGGVVSRPTIAMIGEAGREAVLPLENNTGWMAEMARQLAAAMNGPQLAGGGDILIPVYLDGNLLDQVIVSAQERKNMRSNGR